MVHQSITYQNRPEKASNFPAAELNANCPEKGTVIYPEPCPEPVEVLIPSCKDAIRAELGAAYLLSLGRIVQLDVTIKSVCPGKRVAVSIILSETDKAGNKHPRGVKHILIPAQAGSTCQDVTLRCIPFSVPESLDACGNKDSICNTRHFEAQTIANYVDTDFICCEAEADDPFCHCNCCKNKG